MGQVEIRDYVIWAKHIHGDDGLKDRILELSAGGLVELEVDHFRGMWKKMDDGVHGTPTPGIKPLGRARDEWHKLQLRRGDLVAVEIA